MRTSVSLPVVRNAHTLGGVAVSGWSGGTADTGVPWTSRGAARPDGAGRTCRAGSAFSWWTWKTNMHHFRPRQNLIPQSSEAMSSPAGPRGPFCPTPVSPRSPFSPGGPGGHISQIITLPAGCLPSWLLLCSFLVSCESCNQSVMMNSDSPFPCSCHKSAVGCLTGCSVTG